MDQWLASITTWLVELTKEVFISLWTFIQDGFIWALSRVLGVIGTWIATITVPSFLSSGLNIGSLLSGLPPYALYVAGQTRIGEAMALIGAGVSFYLLRKLLTLGQW